MAGFIFGEGTPWTYEELQRKRSIADKLLEANAQTPRNVGEGLNAIGRALAFRSIDKKASKRDAELKGEFQSQWDSAFGGYGGGGGFAGGPSAPVWTPSAPTPMPKADTGMIGGGRGDLSYGLPPAAPEGSGANLAFPAQGGGTAEDIFMAELAAGGLPEHVVHGIMMNAKDESNFDPNAVGDGGAALGLLQWNGPRKRALEQFAASVGGSPTDPKIQAQFTLHELQGPERAAFEAVMSTKSAGEAGAAFVNHFERPAEQHRARREAAYLGAAPTSYGGGAPASMTAQNVGGMDLGTIAELAGSPYATPGQKAVLAALMQQQMDAMDPMRAIEMQKAQLELAQMQNPQADPMAAVELAQAQLDLEQDRAGTGTDAATYGTTLQFFTDPNGKTRAGVLGSDGTLKEIQPPDGGDWATGIEKVDAGTKWLIYDKRTGTKIGEEEKDIRGAAAEAVIGEAEGKSEVAAPGDMATAETTLSYITSLRDHPGRKAGSGGTSWVGNIPGTAAKEFQIEVERLKSGAFMTAIQQLRGMGALSNAEGQTATAAVAALDPSGTEEGFLKRLAEYEAMVNLGLERARTRTKAPDAATGAAGVPDGVDPAVWEVMTPEERALWQN